jgi:hypothetical protein
MQYIQQPQKQEKTKTTTPIFGPNVISPLVFVTETESTLCDVVQAFLSAFAKMRK